MRNSIFLLFSVAFLFFGCEKEENYIEKLKLSENMKHLVQTTLYSI